MHGRYDVGDGRCAHPRTGAFRARLRYRLRRRPRLYSIGRREFQALAAVPDPSSTCGARSRMIALSCEAPHFPEALVFHAFVPEAESQTYPSTGPRRAALLHRYAISDLDGRIPAVRWGLETPSAAGSAPGCRGSLPRMRQPHHDPQGRLRLLHGVRVRGSVRLIA